MSWDARNQGEERSRFCDSHGGCALGDPHGRAEESIGQNSYEKRKNAAREGGLIGLAAATLKLFPSPSDIRTLCDALESRLEKNPAIRNQLHIWILVKANLARLTMSLFILSNKKATSLLNV
ncbi:hypothetical protein Scep_004730 [Stephania cephalantha]|uniref:Uncharacterized protein n=1 Tax=Stephania cephalantha TaxID=152367 RepID=A0AAP0PZE1_9MAGN